MSGNSDTLQALHEDFLHLPCLPQIYSFYEGRSIAGIGKVVEKGSAFLGLPQEKLISINADHTRMIKFSSPDSEGYRLVMYALKSAVQGLPMAAESPDSA